jgi:hypothetical protein
VWSPPEHRPEPALAAPAHVRVEDPVDDRSLLRRLRAAVLLVITVVALGSLAAGLLGGIVYLGAHVINQALR